MATRLVKLTGFKELERALAELPKATGKNTLRRTAKGALEPMAARARAAAPRDTGALSLRIAVSEKRTRRAKTGFNRSTGIEMAMGPSSGEGVLNYATFAEFGTIDTAAHPFMRPAWDMGADPALEYIKTNLGKEITKSAARLAKKRGF